MLNRKEWLALIALTLMWGINWPMMKLSLQEVSPLYFRAMTMTLGASWLYLFFRLSGGRMVMPQGEQWQTVMLLALPNILGWHVLSIFGVQELRSGRAAILGFTMPIWTVLIGAIWFRERLTRRVVFATVAVALAVLLLVSHELQHLSGRPVGVFWMLAAANCWALGTLLMRRTPLTMPIEAVAVWMLLLSCGVLWALAVSLEPVPSFQFTAVTWWSLVYGVLINYGFAQIIWFGLARRLPPASSAMSVMAVPLVGIGSAIPILGETPYWQDGVAVLLVMVAIAAVLLPKRSPSSPSSESTP
ncbi:MAG: hypothetical protein RLZZ612_489 [Pseudomonadota bacterium]|jgi:drug/metabolite transporter (DMT)-like permease